MPGSAGLHVANVPCAGPPPQKPHLTGLISAAVRAAACIDKRLPFSATAGVGIGLAIGFRRLSTLLVLLLDRWRLLFRVLAATGLRISEPIAVGWHHLMLDGSTPHVQVRRAIVRNRLGQVKSRHDAAKCAAIRGGLAPQGQRVADDEHPLFACMVGTPLDPETLRRRRRVGGGEADIPWCSLRTFRHICAGSLFDRGANATQVQWLGHHKSRFRLDTYVHLLSDHLGEPLNLTAELAQGGVKVAPRPLSVGVDERPPDWPDSASEVGWSIPTEADRDAPRAHNPKSRGSHPAPATFDGPAIGGFRHCGGRVTRAQGSITLALHAAWDEAGAGHQPAPACLAPRGVSHEEVTPNSTPRMAGSPARYQPPVPEGTGLTGPGWRWGARHWRAKVAARRSIKVRSSASKWWLTVVRKRRCCARCGWVLAPGREMVSGTPCEALCLSCAYRERVP
jgi:hypothetical protein